MVAKSPTPPATAGSVHCPSCHRAAPTIGHQCPHCGYTGSRCMARFPFPAPTLAPVMDQASLFDEDGNAAVAAAIHGFTRAFPQAGCWICTLRLDPAVDPREFGFWMMNACPVRAAEDAVARTHGVLVLYDAARPRLAVTLGYRMEHLVSHAWMDRSLDELAAGFRDGRAAPAIVAWLARLARHLHAAWTLEQRSAPAANHPPGTF